MNQKYPALFKLKLLNNADDILLTAPSVGEWQELFDACVIELNWLDMNINEKVLLYPHWSTMGCEVQEH